MQIARDGEGGMTDARDLSLARERDLDRERERGRRVRTLEGALTDIGVFRMVRVPDLRRIRYGDNHSACERDLQYLLSHGVVERMQYPDMQERRWMDLVVLSKKLDRVMTMDLKRGLDTHGEQALHAGWPRRDFFQHDVQIYPASVDAIREIEARGGTVERVILEREFIGVMQRQRPVGPAERERLARELRLRVVNGRIPVPDVQIRYRERDGRDRELNLEIPSRGHASRPPRAEAAAGFVRVSRRQINGQNGRYAARDRHNWMLR
jgi:hypothetical protein